MEETVLLYNLKDSIKGETILTILKQLGIAIKHVEAKEVLHPIGYLLTIDGFQPAKKEVEDEKIEEEMLVIHNFSDQQIQVMLEVLKEAGVPLIPLKAVVTPTNVEWSFYTLYQEVKKEYQMMSAMKEGK